jgi:hypothetical protein
MAGNSDTPILDLVATMTAASIEASNLDADKLMLARIAALVAVGAPPVSYLLNIGAAADLDPNEIEGVLAAVAPIVGTPRVAAAAGNIMRATGLALNLAELAGEQE